jgi:PadR family transcriptional regulator, regulatory protein PadR
MGRRWLLIRGSVGRFGGHVKQFLWLFRPYARLAKRLQRANEGEALFKEGTVYPVLRALSADGFLRSRIEPSDAGPPRPYYRITKEGRGLLEQWSGIWSQTRDVVDRCLRGVAP